MVSVFYPAFSCLALLLIFSSSGQHINVCDVFNGFTSEVHRVLELDKPQAFETSETSVGSFFDTLQAWALNFMQFVFEPIMEELHRIKSPNAPPDAAGMEISHSDRFIQENPTRFESVIPNSERSKARNTNFLLKERQKQSSQTKMLADVEFIRSNVSSSAHILLCSGITFIFAGSARCLADASCLVVCAVLRHDFAARAENF
jgi:hypothetical protein